MLEMSSSCETYWCVFLFRYGGKKTDSWNQGTVLVVLETSISSEASWCVFLFTQYSLPTVNRELKDCDCDQTNHPGPKKDKMYKAKKRGNCIRYENSGSKSESQNIPPIKFSETLTTLAVRNHNESSDWVRLIPSLD